MQASEFWQLVYGSSAQQYLHTPSLFKGLYPSVGPTKAGSFLLLLFLTGDRPTPWVTVHEVATHRTQTRICTHDSQGLIPLNQRNDPSRLYLWQNQNIWDSPVLGENLMILFIEVLLEFMAFLVVRYWIIYNKICPNSWILHLSYHILIWKWIFTPS